MTPWIIVGVLAAALVALGIIMFHVASSSPVQPAPPVAVPATQDEDPDPIPRAFGTCDSVAALLAKVRMDGRKLYSLTVYGDGSCDYTLSERCEESSRA